LLHVPRTFGGAQVDAHRDDHPRARLRAQPRLEFDVRLSID
jgi:hypothetical protein